MRTRAQEAHRLVPEHRFGLGIFDEAHRTACADRAARYAIALHDANVRIARRVFLTATQRMRKVRKSLNDSGATSFSMDDESVYGRCAAALLRAFRVAGAQLALIRCV
jgi:predicted helicase